MFKPRKCEPAKWVSVVLNLLLNYMEAWCTLLLVCVARSAVRSRGCVGSQGRTASSHTLNEACPEEEEYPVDEVKFELEGAVAPSVEGANTHNSF